MKHRHIIVADLEPGVPPPSTRTLKRYASEEANDGPGRAEQIASERNDVWHDAQARRRQRAGVGLWTRPCLETLHTLFEKAGPVTNFVGEQGVSHRCLFFSHDVVTEAGPAPWAAPAAWDPVSDVILQCMMERRTNTDVLVMFDGRCRDARRRIEDVVAGNPNAFESWVVYKPTVSTTCRTVSFASDNQEVAWILLPCSRVNLSTTARRQFTACGEASTHDSTYSGVASIPLRALPQISLADKQEALGLGAPPAAAPADVLDSVVAQPLFWQERKPADLLRQLMRDLCCRAVFDLTPGSGTPPPFPALPPPPPPPLPRPLPPPLPLPLHRLLCSSTIHTRTHAHTRTHKVNHPIKNKQQHNTMLFSV